MTYKEVANYYLEELEATASTTPDRLRARTLNILAHYLDGNIKVEQEVYLKKLDYWMKLALHD